MKKQTTKGFYNYSSAIGKYRYFKKKEEQFKIELKKDNLYVIRFDGSGMTKGFKIKHKAINKPFFETMQLTFENFAKKYPQILLGYCFSDEISILFRTTKENELFARGAKLLSIMSGQLALEFYKAAQIVGLDCKGQDWILMHE